MSRNFPLLKSLLPIAALVAAFSGVASAETCTGFKWSVATELSWVAAPDAEAVATGGKIVSIPDKAIELTLEPSPSVKLPATPGIKKQAIAKNSFSGWFSIADVGKPGLYQITIPSHAWIDVVQNDALVSTVAFSGDKNCKSLRKSVQYDLGAGPAIIQISGAPDKSMKLTIHAAEKNEVNASRSIAMACKSRRWAFIGFLAATSIATAAAFRPVEAASLRTPIELGRALFADRNLSFSRKQNCVSCHSPELAFTDPRALGDVQGAVSRGGDGHSLGDRNSPTLSYIMMTPPFHISAEHTAAGGMFWDGRARTITDQVRDPILNPIEMGMPDEASVVARLRESADYQAAFHAIFGPSVLDDTPKAFAALQTALAAYLKTSDFAPFDSRYDKSLRGEAALSQNEARGRDLFFAANGAGCSRCHSSTGVADSRNDAFTNFRYYNLGVPENVAVRRLNGSAAQRVDHGLMQNPAAHDPTYDGAFKVPTLRNIAVTGPYMHNGAFQELRTAVLFHLRFSDGSVGKINPETGTAWNAPEDGTNLATSDLKARPLSDADVDALIAFLKTLTDRAYESLVDN